MRILQPLLVCAALAAALAAVNFKLYLKDGSEHLVREYQVEGDRLRFYSVERSGWEEVPLEMVDVARTESVRQRLATERETRAAEDKRELEAERVALTELHRVPLDDGVYWIDGDEMRPLKQGESKVKSNKRRSVLKVVIPMPVVSGKATVELAGPASAFVVNAAAPQFYIRLDKTERFGICRLRPKKDARVVEDLTIVPITKEVIESQKEVEVFRHQLAPTVYRIWPVKPLEPGEYAVVQFTQDKVNVQVWDFAYRNPNAPPPGAKPEKRPARPKT